MGTLVDSLGRSIVDNKTVVVTGQIGDTIDLNAVGGRFGREGKAIYRVTLSNGKDELTLPDYQSSFTLTEQLKQYDRISIAYETSLVLKDKEHKQPHSPAPQGLGNNQQIPAPQGQGNNQQTPAPQGQGDNQQTPSPQVSGNNQQAPSPQVSGNGQQAPAPQVPGNNQQTPSPQADLSTRRNQLLLELDKSPLTDEQKGQLAEKFAFANTEKELADVTAEFRRLVAALGQESKQQTPQTPQKADAKATLPATGEAKPAVLAMIGAGLLLASLGLVYHRKRS